MPWHSLPRPSLQLGVLKAACAGQGLPAPAAYHGGLRFAEFLLERTGGVITPFDYTMVAEAGFTHALGDWVFSGALYEPEFGLDGMRDYASRHDIPLHTVTTMREHAGEFVDLVVDEVLALEPEVAGFSSTFMQNVPSLAVAARLKRRRPGVTILFGGGNCDGEMGAALHREFGFVDLVLRGEADETLPRLLQACAAIGDGSPREAELAAIPGLCWRDEDGRQHISQQPARLVPPGHMPRPDFDDWFAAFAASPVSAYTEAELVVESARGCWWGEHHHCTFCGLNGTAMAFRAKPPEVFVAELDHLIRRHQTLDVMVVDNILEPGYLRSALPDLGDRGWDLRLHYEVKANLSREQIGVLRAAGVYSVQPGLESLIDDVLKRMDKGVQAIRNVRTLRDCESAGLTVSWSWLYGFPGEREEDYRAVVGQLAALVHLQPPDSVARIEMNRFSPYFDDPSLGFPTRRPAEPYRYVYAMGEDRMYDLVYLFETSPRGLTGEQVAPLEAACQAWTSGYPGSSLRQLTVDGAVLLRDRRAGWAPADHVLDDPREVFAWTELERGRSPGGLRRRLDEAGIAWSEGDLRRWLNELRERGLVFTEGGRWISLATTA